MIIHIYILHCSLQLADKSFWHGTPGNYIISCKYHIGQKEVKNCHYSTDANSTRVVLQRLKSAYSYDVFLKMRNAEGKFNLAPSERYVVKKLQGEWEEQSYGVGRAGVWK